jgi:hypothetical protein
LFDIQSIFVYNESNGEEKSWTLRALHQSSAFYYGGFFVSEAEVFLVFTMVSALFDSFLHLSSVVELRRLTTKPKNAPASLLGQALLIIR